MSLLEGRTYYKPMDYPWAFEAYKVQNQVHWLPDEVPLGDDVKDFHTKLTTNEKQKLEEVA